jgi:hypothetical protein
MEVVASRNRLLGTRVGPTDREEDGDGRMFDVWPMARRSQRNTLSEEEKDRWVVDVGDVYAGTVYSARSLLLRNHADLPLAFTLQAFTVAVSLVDESNTGLGVRKEGEGTEGDESKGGDVGEGDVEDGKSELHFSTSRTTLKQFQSLYVDGQSSTRIYTHFTPHFHRTNQVSEEKEVHMTVACRAIKNYQYSISYRCILRHPAIAISTDYLQFGRLRAVR